jgi:hypothetical protein
MFTSIKHFKHENKLIALLKNALSSVFRMFELLVIYPVYHIPRAITWDALVRARTIVLQLRQEKSNTS